MLKVNDAPAIVADVVRYLDSVIGFGIPVLRPRPWADQDKLPFFLQDAISFWQIELGGQQLLLAIEQNDMPNSISSIRRRLISIAKASPCWKQIYVAKRLTAYQRTRLIQQKASFIVPWRQLYLPPLGIDLSERFDPEPARTALSAATPAFTPSAQAILIFMLLSAENIQTWCPIDLGARAGVSTMTVSRAVRELASVGVIDHTGIRNKPQVIALAARPREVWTRVQGLLRSPIRRIGWFPESALRSVDKRTAGLEALARHTMLNPPGHKTYALDFRQWKNVDGALAIPEPDDGFVECQVWNYPANLQAESECVDPLSLALSLAGNLDERVQISVDELIAEMAWR